MALGRAVGSAGSKTFRVAPSAAEEREDGNVFRENRGLRFYTLCHTCGRG